MDEITKKKKFLGKYLEYIKIETEILQNIQELRLNESSPSVTNDGMPHGNDKSDLSDYAVRIDKQIRRLKGLQELREKSRRSILGQINKMDDKDEQVLLRLKHIQGISVDNAAVILGVSRRKAYNIYNSAINNLKL